MKVDDPSTWPQGPNLRYRRISHEHPTTHAFAFDSNTSLCGSINLAPGAGSIPLKTYSRLCSHCIGSLRSWGYLSRSEVVE